MRNVIQSKLTQQDQTKIDKAIDNLEAVIKGKLPALTEEERLKYGSINEMNKLFVNKVYDYRKRNEELSASEVDWSDFEKDYHARYFLENRLERFMSIAFQMESTKILHDYDNYHDALTDYAYSQYKKGAGSNGFTEKVAELKQFFPRTRKTDISEN
ncbi:hypothetical protein OOZ15_02400 [Galbibacter sp. EGI 63066]|uniref:hypothetical protein n=1 Tax=Galbibacter sp. EGI 63066 TaxID=2993559 RepID=UPI00224937FC|nr:hypothetical protein [Galbibacter sp. EGI 63066]MCX2678780.1 hypothetical protein [Galbibacter sp. EGI 63066]